MNPDEWMRQLKALHGEAKKGTLSLADVKTYREACEQLARSLVAAQRLPVDPEKTARRTFRVSQALQVDLDLTRGRERLMTQDLSCGGFAALMREAPGPNETPGFTLKLPGKSEPLIGRVKVTGSVARPGSARVSFAFDGLTEKQLADLELTLFDIVFSRMP